jgi:hypothetical protein
MRLVRTLGATLTTLPHSPAGCDQHLPCGDTVCAVHPELAGGCQSPGPGRKQNTLPYVSNAPPINSDLTPLCYSASETPTMPHIRLSVTSCQLCCPHCRHAIGMPPAAALIHSSISHTSRVNQRLQHLAERCASPRSPTWRPTRRWRRSLPADRLRRAATEALAARKPPEARCPSRPSRPRSSSPPSLRTPLPP